MYTVKPDKVTRLDMAPGSAGVRQTLGIMRKLALEGASHPIVRNVAVTILREARAPAGDYEAEARAVFRWVADRIRYTRDILDVETLQSPWVTLAQGAGDCDDKATLLVALLRAVGCGFPLKFRAIGTDQAKPDQFRHVYVVATIDKRRVPLDATREGAPAGWEFPRPTVSMEVGL